MSRPLVVVAVLGGLALAAGRDVAGPALLVVVVAAAFWGLTGRTATAGRSVSVRGHAHGSGARQEVAIHEAGHVGAGRALGGRIRSATVSPDGRSGLVRVILPTDDPQAAITFLAAGQIAAGTSRGASADDAAIRAELRTVPARDRGRVRRAAERDARRIVGRHRGRIRRDAAALDQKGRL